MMPVGVVLAICQHGGHYLSSNCPACKGAGYVTVIPGANGEPLVCQHGGHYLSSNCPACKGSGWAGMVGLIMHEVES